MPSGPKISIISAFHQAILDQAYHDLPSFFTEDATITARGTPVQFDELVHHFKHRPFETESYEIEEYIQEGSRVAFHGRSVLNQTGPMFGVEPSDDPISSEFAVFAEFEDDRITRWYEMGDQGELLNQLGVLADDYRNETVKNQYYEVLNRVLRHNIRNDLDIVRSYAESLVRDEMNPVSAGEAILETTDEILGTANKARRLQRKAIDTAIDPAAVDLPSVIEETAEQYADRAEIRLPHEGRGPAATADDFVITTDRRLLRTILEEVLENAVVHNTTAREPVVRISLGPTDTQRYAVEIVVADNGPGISESDLAPLRQNTETALVHATGIGCWIVQWAITRLHGAVDYETPTGGGTRVRLSLPNLE